VPAAVLILRNVVQFSAAEVAELLETTPAAVKGSLQRARAHLAAVSPTEESVSEPDDAERCELLDRYCAAFENADMAALTELLQAEVKLEMPPVPVRFTGRDTVMRFLVARAFTKAGDMVMIPTAANGQSAVAEYRRGADQVMRAHSLHILTTCLKTGTAGIAAITFFSIRPCLPRLDCRQAGKPLKREAISARLIIRIAEPPQSPMSSQGLPSRPHVDRSLRRQDYRRGRRN
jgi:RNA polymerase sigma-70 factor (ECF subfamily)